MSFSKSFLIAFVAASFWMGSANVVYAADADRDGLPDAHDLCPNQNDDWFLVPSHWVGLDSNGIEDDHMFYVQETVDGQSAVDISESLSDSYASLDDLGEELTAITLAYLFDEGSDYVYDAIDDANTVLTGANKKQAANFGDTYLYGGDLEHIFGEREETGELSILFTTDYAGVIQKNCTSRLSEAREIRGEYEAGSQDEMEERIEDLKLTILFPHPDFDEMEETIEDLNEID